MSKKEHPSIAISKSISNNYYYHCLSYSTGEHHFNDTSPANVIGSTNLCHTCANKKCIYHNNYKIFKYYLNVCKCVACKGHLDFGYIIIISRLREHNLLKKDIDFLCCRCSNKKENGGE